MPDYPCVVEFVEASLGNYGVESDSPSPEKEDDCGDDADSGDSPSRSRERHMPSMTEVAKEFELDRDLKQKATYEIICATFLLDVLKDGVDSSRCLPAAKSALDASTEEKRDNLVNKLRKIAAKTSIVSLSRGLAELSKGSRVTVNSVLPGPTWTEGVEKYFDGLAAEEGKPSQELIDNYFAEHEPTSLLQRFVDVKEVAHAVVFLALNGAVNGSAQRVEGGIIRSI